MIQKLKFLAKKLRSYFPSPLPVGMAEYEKWSDSILELSGKYADVDSMKFAISTNVLHAGADLSSVPKNFFVKRLRKAAANQIVSQAIQDIKHKQQAAIEAAKSAEATAVLPTVDSSGTETKP